MFHSHHSPSSSRSKGQKHKITIAVAQLPQSRDDQETLKPQTVT